jgi:MarR family transcriptional regulator, 2-MHQ and catechol-resistance regulon repressor
VARTSPDKKSRTPEMPEQEVIRHLMYTTDRLQNRLGKLVRQHGLTLSQYHVLRILRDEGVPLPSQDIGERMMQVVPAMTGLTDRLERRGLVSRRRGDTDRRVIYIELTRKAYDTLKQLDQPLADLHQQLLGHLPKSDLRKLSQLLEKAGESLRADAASAP